MNILQWDEGGNGIAGREAVEKGAQEKRNWELTHLLTGLGIQQYPAKFNDFCRVLGDIDSMFITGGSDVDDNVAV
jgi:hypothetical protein